jgi:hypothetical protein
VSTNSISQGEQVGILWKHLVQKYNINIHFAHRTFRWSNEAKGVAAVHCVIIGFGHADVAHKHLFDYASVTAPAAKVEVPAINGYLTAGNQIFVSKRSQPLCEVKPMLFGSMPNDGGKLLLSVEESNQLIEMYPELKKWVRSILGAEEFLNGGQRYTLWLDGITPSDIRKLPTSVIARIEDVRKLRSESTRSATVELAKVPWLWGEIRHGDSDYLLVPRVSSENRVYIPMGFLSPNTISTDANLIVPDASLYHFGILTSTMHMSWVRYVCGRLKSDYRYSKDLVYNNYPWPEPTDAQREKVEALAQGVLDARANHPTSTLADLYHPTTMPPDLRKAHDALDKAVDQCYRKEPFTSERERVEYLFGLYRKLTEGFGAEELSQIRKKRKKRSNKSGNSNTNLVSSQC